MSLRVFHTARLFDGVSDQVIENATVIVEGNEIREVGADIVWRGEIELCGCGAYSGVITQAVDGTDAMRKAVREQFRQGATHIKIFLSGGVSTDLAPIDMPHFCDDEIAVAVEEAALRGSYGMAHCHTDEGARRCVALCVRTIEHGSLITAPTAKRIAEAGAFVVPTLSAGELIGANAAALGLPVSATEKVHAVNRRALEAVEACAAAGVKLGLGCDLHGDVFLQKQTHELMLRAQIQAPLEVLRSATSVNAEIVQMQGKLGHIAPGALADMILVDGDPTEGISVFADPLRSVVCVVKDGITVRDRMAN